VYCTWLLSLWHCGIRGSLGVLDKRGFEVLRRGNSLEPYKGFRLFCVGVLSEDKSNRVVIRRLRSAWQVSVKAVPVFVGRGRKVMPFIRSSW
jgi:hypothetical protein